MWFFENPAKKRHKGRLSLSQILVNLEDGLFEGKDKKCAINIDGRNRERGQWPFFIQRAHMANDNRKQQRKKVSHLLVAKPIKYMVMAFAERV